MDTKTSQTHSPLLSSSRSTRRKGNNECTSPEFEFWMLRNPSFPQPNILPADQLFHDGVILPLHLISTKYKPEPHQKPDSSSAAITSDSTTTTTTSSNSKRWKDIFRKKNNNNAAEEKVKKKDKRVGNNGGGGGVSSAELNINLWPFFRSSSAGNSTTKPKSFTGAPFTRKVNSAPCSRSNSAGDSKSRKWPSSPGRAGVHLGRSSPVWQVPRRGGCSATSWNRRSRLASTGGGGKGKVLNLNVPMSIEYSNDSGCRIEENSGGSKLFNLRTFFTKKTVLMSH
ncbi:hypothetical protein TSUD_203150 [Trifolium subterraneum]|uniref:Uncharacterized protein n=1 Tax=Trifolium subterraneum TaxID=3900 RepID=A0A2Z6LHT1_TRISU|nr:hypothetical protein TSUD_203150 [Trifolium subterraneum]